MIRSCHAWQRTVEILAEVQERMVAYARFAQEEGAQVILEACSSVGEIVPRMQAAVTIPVVRIDWAMAEEAVRRSVRIGVAATLPTTLQPTARLLQEKAAAIGKQVLVHSQLIEGAFEKLSAGDRAGHDALLVAGLSALVQEVDLVVLAQASMARVVPQLPASEQDKFLTSPRSGMLRVKSLLETPKGKRSRFKQQDNLIMALLAIDIGTTHCKAGLFDIKGKAIKIASRPTIARQSTGGWSYYDPQNILDTVAEIVIEVTQDQTEPVAAVGIASMAETGLLVDRQTGAARSDFIPWFETNAQSNSRLDL
jgi:hypothetical protein